MKTSAAMPCASPPRTPRLRTNADRWRAVLLRNPAADGEFFYAVRTTGVYCRPSCAARKPLRTNVRFFNSVAEARAAGFRPCRRCHPDGAALPARQATLVAQACRLLDAANPPPRAGSLARTLGLSRFHLLRLFRAHLGVTLQTYVAARRAERARAALQAGRTVTAAMHGAGYSSSGRFYAAAARELGMRPKTYGSGGAGETIQFASERSWLGHVLVAATPRGVCAVLLGDNPAALRTDLQARFPRAHITAGNRQFARLVRQVVRQVEMPQQGVLLPLDLRGTAFQQRVWQALREIPPGQTRSYTELAQQLGQPRAVRAVAAACAANPAAVVVPCHRAVRRDGSLAGYRWGMDRKRKLLEREAKKSRRPRFAETKVRTVE